VQPARLVPSVIHLSKCKVQRDISEPVRPPVKKRDKKAATLYSDSLIRIARHHPDIGIDLGSIL
jgi:hypothetical protein